MLRPNPSLLEDDGAAEELVPAGAEVGADDESEEDD